MYCTYRTCSNQTSKWQFPNCRCGVQRRRDWAHRGGGNSVWWCTRDERGLHCPPQTWWEHGSRDSGTPKYAKNCLCIISRITLVLFHYQWRIHTVFIISSFPNLQVTKAIIYIEEKNSMADVTFPAVPVVVSLSQYDDTSSTRDSQSVAGYPVVCVTVGSLHMQRKSEK